MGGGFGAYRLRLALLLAAGLLAPAAARPEPLPSPAATPAVLSPIAERAVLLGIARAGTRLVAVGERGTVLLSDDAARHWRQATVPVSVSLVAVQFATPREGWAVGHLGVVIHTSDGGESWVRQLEGTAAADLARRDALARQQAGAGDPALLAEQLQFADSLVEDGADKPFLDLLVSGPSSALLVGSYNLAFETHDAGASWQPLLSRIDNPQGLHLYAVRQAGSARLIAGEAGSLFRSPAQDAPFAPLATPYDGSYFGLLPLRGALLLFGLRGTLLRSPDDGASWATIDTGIAASLAAGLTLSDGSVALLSQDGDILLGDAAGTRFSRIAGVPQRPSAGIVEASDGVLVTVGVGGARRIGIAPVQP